jgi:photosystem II stability/assembly factor-like uncharacterized protein
MPRVFLILALLASMRFIPGEATAWAAGGAGTSVRAPWASHGFDTLSFINATHGCAGGANIITCTPDAGASWRTALLPGGTVTQLQLIDPNHGWAVIGGGLWETSSTGRYWSRRPERYAFAAVDFISRQLGWAVTPQGQLIVTRNGGITFSAVPTPTPVNAVDFLDSASGWIVGRTGETLFTNDGGTSWSLRSTEPLAASFPDGGRAQLEMVTRSRGWLLLAAGQACATQMPYVVYHTDDGGSHWTPRAVGPSACGFRGYPAGPLGVGGYAGNLFALDADTAVLGVSNLAASRFYAVRTADAGRHWEQTNPLKRSLNAPALAMDFVSPLIGWAVTGGEISANATGHILHTVDGGLTWHTQLVQRH